MSHHDGPSEDIYDPSFVKDVFDRCSETYILFSSVMSFGFTERWRRQCSESLPSPKTDGRLCYDIMSGTGEVWPHILKAHPDTREIRAVDISSGMHERALKRMRGDWDCPISFECADVLGLDIEAETADMIVSTFGLKTFNAEQHKSLARFVVHTLKPGGSFALIEASDPKGWVLRPLYTFYLHGVLPLVERFILRGATDFRMIGQYTKNFGNASDFAQALRDEGLEVEYHRYFFGCATGVSGKKPLKD
ncbi:MAG: class I SAM-dependent methyltransferase [Pseudomonadota bacterium]